ncbi:Methyltransferase domain family [Verrucomicrobiia bacterium DG1235]|nr:Methyltransferase domain family [Verrucomicrobiae bacterium DG1235]
MPSFDTIAGAYERLERLTFAGSLQAARFSCLDHVKACEFGLLIGDGDGRFSSELLQQNPSIKLDSIDISPRMLELAQARSGPNAARLTTINANAIEFSYPKNSYDFIGLHFCLDCFTQSEISRLLPRLENALKPGGIIAYSDFQSQNTWHRVAIRLLYLSFKLVAGLKTQNLPQVEWSEQLKPIEEKQFLGGLVFSKLLRKKEAQPTFTAAALEIHSKTR